MHLSTLFNSIIWSFDPAVIKMGSFEVRWYGVLFASAFFVGLKVMTYIFKNEGIDVKHLDKLTIYLVLGTVLGARIGHCFFYEWDYFSTKPWAVITEFRNGGLASHGGGIGLFLACYLFLRQAKIGSYLWLIDRVALIVVLGGFFIRMGNFTNSEIIGKPSDSFTSIIFETNAPYTILSEKALEGSRMSFYTFDELNFTKTGRDTVLDGISFPIINVQAHYSPQLLSSSQDDRNMMVQASLFNAANSEITDRTQYIPIGDFSNLKLGKQQAEFSAIGVSRHPSQLYEAISCLIIFLILISIYKTYLPKIGDGFLFGLFSLIVFSLRFIYEFSKENQVSWEEGRVLNQGQVLSIPFILLGIILIIFSFRKIKTQVAE